MDNLDVHAICLAYEDGVGKANRPQIANPFAAGTPCHQAWQEGVDHGKENQATPELELNHLEWIKRFLERCDTQTNQTTGLSVHNGKLVLCYFARVVGIAVGDAPDSPEEMADVVAHLVTEVAK